MDLKHVFLSLKHRWYLPVIAVIATLLLAAGWMAIQTPMYRATAQVFVSSSGSANAAQTGQLYQSAVFAQQRVATYAQLVSSPEVLEPVISELKLAATPKDLAGSVTAVNPPQTVLLEVTATNSSPTQAAAVSNAIAAHLASAIQKLETTDAKAGSPLKVTVTKPAVAPTAPYSPNPTTTLGLAFILGLAVGVGIALLREQFDTSIKGATDLMELAGATPLGVIGFDPDAEKEPLAALNQQAMRSEAFRQIRTNLQYVDVDNPPKVVAITSSLPNEGKSTSACNLAITMSQAGLRVCLVEADLRRPRIAEYLGIDSAVGLTDVLAGKMSLREGLLPWNRYLLSVLPSGSIPPNPSELLASGQMRSILRELREEFDIVIVDTAPLLAVADGSIAAAAADGAILMVRHGRTTVDQVGKSLDALRQVDARLLGSVLNYAPSKRRGYGYGGYGSTYGSARDRSAGRFRRPKAGTSAKDSATPAPIPEPVDR